MKKDKEFKAVNRDTSYVKDKSPDMKLGRHEEFTTTPKQSTPQKNHRTRHPTAENSYTPSVTDTGNVQQDTGNSNTAEYVNNNHSNSYSDFHLDNSSAAVDTNKQEHTDLQEQPRYSEPAVNSENAFVTDAPDARDTPESSAHRQRRAYSEHTQLGQKSVDYDFTKEHHSDFSFTDNAENKQSEHSEPIYNEPNEDITDDTPLNYERRDTAEQPKKSNSVYRRHSRRHTPKSTDYNISQTSKNDEYNFNAEKSSDIPFERTEHKTNKQTSNRSKTHGNFNTDNKTDKAETRTEPTTETDGDYDIGEAVKNSDTVFDRAADVGEKSEKSEKSELKPNQKKNKRLREKRRLQTEDNTSSDNSGKSDNADGSASKESKSTQKSDRPRSSKNTEQTEGGTKEYQFKRAEKAEFKAERARAKADKAERELPKKKKIKRQRLYDEEKKKVKSKLVFETDVKPQKDLYHRTPVKTAAGAAGVRIANKAHSKISETERDNSAVEGAHNVERSAETLTRYSAKTARYAKRHIKEAPYKKAQRLKFKAEMNQHQ